MGVIGVAIRILSFIALYFISNPKLAVLLDPDQSDTKPASKKSKR